MFCRSLQVSNPVWQCNSCPLFGKWNWPTIEMKKNSLLAIFVVRAVAFLSYIYCKSIYVHTMPQHLRLTFWVGIAYCIIEFDHRLLHSVFDSTSGWFSSSNKSENCRQQNCKMPLFENMVHPTMMVLISLPIKLSISGYTPFSDKPK